MNSPRIRSDASRLAGRPATVAPLAAVATQQEQPGALYQGIERHSLGLGETFQVLGGIAVQARVQRLVPISFAGSVEGVGQIGRLVHACQLAAPEGLAGLAIARPQPGDVVPVRDGGRQAAAGIEFEYLAEQLRSAPAIDENVVVGPDQLVAILAQAQQAYPLQRRLAQVEALAPLLLRDLFQRFVAYRPPTPVEDLERQPGIGQDKLQGLFLVQPEEAAAQHFMALRHRRPGALQALRIESVDRDAQLVDVQLGVRAVQPEEQHALLHRREAVEVFQPFVGQRQRLHLLRQ